MFEEHSPDINRSESDQAHINNEKLGPSPADDPNRSEPENEQRLLRTSNNTESTHLFKFVESYHNLHGHHRDEMHRNWGEVLPHELRRTGSNCGEITAELLADHYFRRFRNEIFTRTDHSRDAEAAPYIPAITKTFYDQYLNEPFGKAYLVQQFGKSGGLSDEELAQVWQWSETAARQIIGYGDERLQSNNEVLDRIQSMYLDTVVIKGGRGQSPAGYQWPTHV